MKVYIYYLIDPSALNDNISALDMDRFSSVMDTLTAKHLLDKHGYRIFVNDIPRYLYAFTDDKSVAKNFEELHQMNLFTKIERKMDKEAYINFKSTMEHAHLEYDDSSLLLTNLERFTLERFFDEVEVYLSHYADFDYTIFKDEYIEALDFLLYTLHYQLNGPDYGFYDYNFSFGQTPVNYPRASISYEANTIANYCKIFKILLK